MEESKLVSLLKSFNHTEFSKFQDFLKSPYHNRDWHICALYDYLAMFYPNFPSAQLSADAAFAYVFPGQPFSLNKLRKLMTALTRLVERYFAQLEFDCDDLARQKAQAKAYARRNLSDAYIRQIHDLTVDLEAAPARGRDYHGEQLELQLGLFFHLGVDKQKAGRVLLEKAMYHLDAFYVVTKLQLSAEMRTRENILQERYAIRLFAETIAEARRSFAPDNPMVDLYLQLIELHEDAALNIPPGPIVACFRTILASIKLEERQTILNHLLNHCIRLINHGATGYRQDLFDLYQLGIEHDLLLENGRITELTFSNIVAIGANLSAFEWTWDFIERYAIYLEAQTREDIVALSRAIWFFNKKDYDQSERALIGHKFRNMLNHIKSRCLLIRTYFEQFLLNHDNYFFLLDQIEAFEKFIRRNNYIAQDKSRNYLNFSKFSKKLAHMSYHGEQLHELRRQIEIQTAISYKEWLLEKTVDL